MRFSVATVIAASAAVVAAYEVASEQAPSGYAALEPSSTASAPVSPETTPAGYGQVSPSTTVSSTSYETESSTVSVTASTYETLPTVTPSAPVSPETTCPAAETVTVTVTVGGADCGISSTVAPPYPTGTDVVVPGGPTGTAPGTAPGSGSTGTAASSYPSSTVVPFEGAGANVKASFGLGAVAAVAALFL